MPSAETDISPVIIPADFGSTVTKGLQTNTRVDFDIPSVVVKESWWGAYRQTSQIAPIAATRKATDSQYSQSMRFWKSGCISLRPIQDDFSGTYELPPDDFDPSKYLYQTSDMGAVLELEIVKARNMIYTAYWVQPIGIGIVAEPGVAAIGDPMLKQAISAGSSWDTGQISPPSPQRSTTAGLITGTFQFKRENIPLDTWWYTARNQPTDQGYFLRWLFPGIDQSTPDWLFDFFFGQYCLCVDGSGMATLAEYCQPAGGGGFRWVLRAKFRYCQNGSAIGQGHTMQIFPHRGPRGQKFIIFSGNNIDVAQTGSYGLLTGGNEGAALITDEFLYEANELNRGSDIDPAPEFVTKSAPMRLDVRREMRPGFHISRLVFRNQGAIVDSIHGLPDFHTTIEDNPFKIRMDYVNPVDQNGDQGSITPIELINAYESGAGENPYVTFRFDGTGVGGPNGASWVTPLLYGYLYYREGTFSVQNPGAFSLPVSPSVSLSNIGGPDPREENGQAGVRDVKAEYSTRLSRGKLAARVVMDYYEDEEAETPVPIVLSRGFALRPRYTQKGKGGNVYPAEGYRDYSVLLTGEAARLSNINTESIAFELFALDEDAVADSVSGVKPPWKVTDVIRYLLAQKGYPAEQIIVPDIPIRLWSGNNSFTEDSVFDINTDIVSRCVSLARNYLGAYIVWESNEGPAESVLTGDSEDITPLGAWRLVQPPALGATVTPLANFVGAPTQVAEEGQFLVPHLRAAYDSLEIPIFKEIQGWTDEPEANHIWVMTAPPIGETKGFQFSRHVYNPYAYEVPGSTITPSPDTKDYCADGEKLYIVPDASLFVPNNLPATQRAVDWTARRILDFVGHARDYVVIEAPYELIYDESIGKMRPLRYYDPVQYRGQDGWLIRTVSVNIDSPQHLATYELTRIVPFGEAIES